MSIRNVIGKEPMRPCVVKGSEDDAVSVLRGKERIDGRMWEEFCGPVPRELLRCFLGVVVKVYMEILLGRELLY